MWNYMTFFSQARRTCGTTHFICLCTILHATGFGLPPKFEDWYSQTCLSDHLLLSNNVYYVPLIFISLHSAFHITLNLYLATTCLMWAYFSVPLEGHIGQVWLYIVLILQNKSTTSAKLSENSRNEHHSNVLIIFNCVFYHMLLLWLFLTIHSTRNRFQKSYFFGQWLYIANIYPVNATWLF
jgi:hypothetical protein